MVCARCQTCAMAAQECVAHGAPMCYFRARKILDQYQQVVPNARLMPDALIRPVRPAVCHHFPMCSQCVAAKLQRLEENLHRDGCDSNTSPVSSSHASDNYELRHTCDIYAPIMRRFKLICDMATSTLGHAGSKARPQGLVSLWTDA